ncbi:DUF7115 domain-containing protein [Natrinema halophilum]|uniref:DUF7115 domain-containing protein n=1 Tax=Natrinema halophilum TaxID=1699371 RepID=A0A7D5KJC4_9EURY|nr:hypothetical protein [Natrinema halophilum]QLG47918.1 hypothetical protein HYG82_03185 [Natrinema halophilum]
MSVPGIVHSTLDGEEIAARISLGSDDEIFITPTRTIVYRSDGLLSDESADEFPHDADRLTLSEGRRKTKFTLEYALDGEQTFAIPAGKTDDILHPVLAGVLNGNGITDTGETVVKTYRFSELTLILTSDRLVKHIGSAVWDDDYEEYHFDDVTKLAFEDGSVATQIVLTVDGRPQRIKAPNEAANDLRERLQRVLFDYHDVSSLEELNDVVGDAEDVDGSSSGSVDFGGGVDPLDADPPEPDDHEATGGSPSNAADSRSADPLADGATDDATPTDPGSSSPPDNGGSVPPSGAASATTNQPDEGDELTETASILGESEFDPSAADAGIGSESGADRGRSPPETDPELLERLEALETAVERQSEIIDRQQQTIDRLISELRQGR